MLHCRIYQRRKKRKTRSVRKLLELEENTKNLQIQQKKLQNLGESL